MSEDHYAKSRNGNWISREGVVQFYIEGIEPDSWNAAEPRYVLPVRMQAAISLPATDQEILDCAKRLADRIVLSLGPAVEAMAKFVIQEKNRLEGRGNFSSSVVFAVSEQIRGGLSGEGAPRFEPPRNYLSFEGG